MPRLSPPTAPADGGEGPLSPGGGPLSRRSTGAVPPQPRAGDLRPTGPGPTTLPQRSTRREGRPSGVPHTSGPLSHAFRRPGALPPPDLIRGPHAHHFTVTRPRRRAPGPAQ